MLAGIWLLTLLILAVAGVLHYSGAFRIPQVRLNITLPALVDRYFWLWLLPLTLLFRLPMMFDSAWYDEAFTGVMVSVPLDKFMVALRGDVHPPLYYVLAKISVAIFGYSDAALRLPALAAGLLLVPATYRLARGLTGQVVTARLVAVIVAFMPAQIHYSNEARYPEVLTLAVVVSMAALVESRRRWWLVATVVAPLLHATGIVYAGFLVLVALRRRWWLPAGAVSAVVAAVVVFMLQQAHDISDGFWLWQMLPVTHLTEGTVLLPSPPAGIIAYMAVILLMLAGVRALYKASGEKFLLLMIGLAPFAVWGISAAWHPVYLPRALMASSLVIVVGWGVLIRQHLIYQVAVVLSLSLSIPGMYSRHESIPLRDLMAYCAGADVIYATSTSMTIVAKHYAPPGARVLSYWGGNSINQSLPMDARLAMGYDFTPVEFAAGRICHVIQWNNWTGDRERSRVIELTRHYHPDSIVLQGNGLLLYQVLRWTNG